MGSIFLTAFDVAIYSSDRRIWKADRGIWKPYRAIWARPFPLETLPRRLKFLPRDSGVRPGSLGIRPGDSAPRHVGPRRPRQYRSQSFALAHVYNIDTPVERAVYYPKPEETAALTGNELRFPMTEWNFRTIVPEEEQ